uniref:ATP synthase subunit a n=1 Tax=Ligia oceanica TaxID=96856 RepID=Q09TE7_LIGOC|nr:ATP synthase F0 subunit 6 [Ligia oceanica]
MMSNLFSIFDPSSSMGAIPMNWVALWAGISVLVYPMWVVPSRSNVVMIIVIKSLFNEMRLLLRGSGESLVLVFLALFFVILMNNLLGLVPHVFTTTSHLIITLSLALPLWLGYYSRGWVTNTTHMLAHLVPQGTPSALMPFMVLIESISSIIRPGTLAVRLAANMIAGHLLLALMSGAITIFSPSSGLMIAVSQIALFALEVAVAAIQAYVFAVLSALYASEV